MQIAREEHDLVKQLIIVDIAPVVYNHNWAKQVCLLVFPSARIFNYGFPSFQ